MTMGPAERVTRWRYYGGASALIGEIITRDAAAIGPRPSATAVSGCSSYPMSGSWWR